MDGFAGFYNSPHSTEYTGVKTIRNLTAKQIADMPVEDSTTIRLIDRTEVSNIAACGYVSELKTTSAGVSFRLFDTTAEIDCAFWTNTAYEENTAGMLRNGTCIKAIGSIKTFNGKKSINVASFIEIKTNLLIYHLAAALYQHLYHTKKIGNTTGTNQTGGLTEIQRDIMEIFRNNQGEEDGLDIEVVVKMLNGKYNEKEVKEGIEELLADCHIYWVSDTAYRTTL